MKPTIEDTMTKTDVLRSCLFKAMQEQRPIITPDEHLRLVNIFIDSKEAKPLLQAMDEYASLACQKTLDKDFIKWIFINYEYIPPLDRYAERTQEARVPHFDVEDLLNIYKKVVLP